MTISELREIRETYKERQQLADKITELECMRLSPRIGAYDDTRVQTSVKGDIQADSLIRMEELLAEYNAKLKLCIDLILEFETALYKLTAQERRVMRMYYLDGKTWEQVSEEMDICWTRVHQIRRKAQAKLTN